MPGSTYAIGFVRTYADHLGLDGVALVNQFKQEAAGIDRRTTLTFPSPAPDGRVPGFWPLSIAVLALLAIAGGWYVLRGDLAPLPPRVASVPERLAPPPPPPPPLPAPAQSESASAAAATDGTVAAPAEPAPAGQDASLSAPASTAALPAEAPRSASPALDSTPPAAPSPPPAAAAVPPPPAAAAPAPPPPPPPVPVQAQPEPETSPPSATALLAAPPPKPEPVQPTVPAASSVPSEGRVFGAQNETARVVIRARGESWIQVRDAANNPVLSRVLRPGDSYRVPNTPGLTMMTGNAGNLEVVVDGNPAPSLGAVGLVKRNISLDPDRLRGAQ